MVKFVFYDNDCANNAYSRTNNKSYTINGINYQNSPPKLVHNFSKLSTLPNC